MYVYASKSVEESAGVRGSNNKSFLLPALVVDDAEHRGPDSHEDDEEGVEQEARDQLSSAPLCIPCGVGVHISSTGLSKMFFFVLITGTQPL